MQRNFIYHYRCVEMIQDFANIRAKEEDINVELLGFKTSYRDYENSQILMF
jgi:hypothetical protein